ncbi:hypothetical protein HOY80DRAFT_1095195 [Tuber brumale]|nr:hypothetical protein HOY80DRAFT_1095195 [Tuber brumale]
MPNNWKECRGRMMDMIDRGVEEGLKMEIEKVEKRFGELDAGFQKEEERWKNLEKEWREEKEELIQERDLLKRKRENVLPGLRKTLIPEVVKKEVSVGLEQIVSQAVEGSKRRKVYGEFAQEKGRGKMLPMMLKSQWELVFHGSTESAGWCSVKRFVVVPPRVQEEGFGRRFGLMEEAVGEMKKGIGRLLRARNEAAKWIAYREALKACDDDERADTEDDERFIRRMKVIFKEEEALKRGKLWIETSANLMARARGKRGADVGKANVLGKKLERKANKWKLGSGKGKEKEVFVVSDRDDSLLSDSDAMARRMWLDRDWE